MAKPLSLIMGSIPMTTAAQTVQRGIPSTLPPSFLRVTRRVSGNQVAYNNRAGGRGAARLVQYGAPSVNVSQIGPGEGAAVLIHSFEHTPFPLTTLINLRSGDDMLQQMAQDDIDQKVADFMERYNTLRTAAVYSLFRDGKIYFDGNGELLNTSSGAVTTINAGIPAANLNQLGGIIAASWGTAATDIIAQVNLIKKAALQAGKRPLRHAFYGANIPGYLAANTNIKGFLQSSPALATSLYQSGEIAPGFMGLEWHPVWQSYFVNSAGTVVEPFGGDSIAFTPEPDPGWWEFVEGSYLVPSSIEIQQTVDSALRNLRQVSGKFAYASITHDPAGVVAYAGDTMMPLLKDASQVYIADVTP